MTKYYKQKSADELATTNVETTSYGNFLVSSGESMGDHIKIYRFSTNEFTEGQTDLPKNLDVTNHQSSVTPRKNQSDTQTEMRVFETGSNHIKEVENALADHKARFKLQVEIKQKKKAI